MRFLNFRPLWRLALIVAIPLTLPTFAMAQSGGLSRAARMASNDDVIVQMQQAYARHDRAALAALLPAARGHVLEPWAAYWELKTRLNDVTQAEVQSFLARYPDTYQEDRLRNDWLLVTGKRRDWPAFAAEYPHFRMADDPEVRCYAAALQVSQGQGMSTSMLAQVKRDWHNQTRVGDGCQLAARAMHGSGLITDADVWRTARRAVDDKQLAVARDAVQMVAPDAVALVDAAYQNPLRFLRQQAVGLMSGEGTLQELAALALIRQARTKADETATLMQLEWQNRLTPEQRDWVWATTGKWAAVDLQANALDYYARVSRPVGLQSLDDEALAWQTRAGLRAGQWRAVYDAIYAMSDDARAEPVWVYWLARADQALARSAGTDPAVAQASFERIANHRGFYGKLARETLGRPTQRPAAPPPVSGADRAAVRAHPGFQRALAAIDLGLRSEGVREWNYWVALHQPGGMSDAQLHAAAELACEKQIWDRCINTSERIRGFDDFSQRFPTPLESIVVAHSRNTGIDPAYVYGLIRQESRFVTVARSHVGASGMMQIMPDTARLTAQKIGYDGFRPSMINDPDTNLLIGTQYLRMGLDEFGGSLPMAAAGYNAGPGRPRAWREGPILEAAIWIESIPFGETRDYVKNVLSNTVDYAVVLRGEPQTLGSRLGTIGPVPIVIEAGDPIVPF